MRSWRIPIQSKDADGRHDARWAFVGTVRWLCVRVDSHREVLAVGGEVQRSVGQRNDRRYPGIVEYGVVDDVVVPDDRGEPGNVGGVVTGTTLGIGRQTPLRNAQWLVVSLSEGGDCVQTVGFIAELLPALCWCEAGLTDTGVVGVNADDVHGSIPWVPLVEGDRLDVLVDR